MKTAIIVTLSVICLHATGQRIKFNDGEHLDTLHMWINYSSDIRVDRSDLAIFDSSNSELFGIEL